MSGSRYRRGHANVALRRSISVLHGDVLFKHRATAHPRPWWFGRGSQGLAGAIRQSRNDLGLHCGRACSHQAHRGPERGGLDRTVASDMPGHDDMTPIRITDVAVDDERIRFSPSDGRAISAPVSWSRRLVGASAAERANYSISPSGTVVEWPAIDEHNRALVDAPSARTSRFLCGRILRRHPDLLRPEALGSRRPRAWVQRQPWASLVRLGHPQRVPDSRSTSHGSRTSHRDQFHLDEELR